LADPHRCRGGVGIAIITATVRTGLPGVDRINPCRHAVAADSFPEWFPWSYGPDHLAFMADSTARKLYGSRPGAADHERKREPVRKFKQKAAVTLTTAAMLAGSVVVSSPANAASSPIAACGGGSYHEIDHHDLSGATIHLMYDGAGTDCVVTWKTANVGTRTEVEAFIERASDGSAYIDDANYLSYAGPVKIYAPRTCIVWSGGVDYNGWHGWASDWSHCG
jgi:hypothetical protein